MGRLWCAFGDSHMQVCTNTNMYVKTLNILPCIFLQFRTRATTKNSCREKPYSPVAVTGITEACIDVSEIKDKNTQSDAFQETLNSAVSQLFPPILNCSKPYIVLF